MIEAMAVIDQNRNNIRNIVNSDIFFKIGEDSFVTKARLRGLEDWVRSWQVDAALAAKISDS